MNAKAFFLLSLALTFLAISPVWGQRVEDSLYYDLASAYLVVRLPSQEKKVRAMQATIDDPATGESARTRLQAQVEQVRNETNVKNQAIIRAFDQYFTALPVVFVYDTTHHPRQAVFLNEQLKPAEPPELGTTLLQLRFGRPVSYSGSRAESMVLTDSHLQDLGSPFPKPVMMTGFGYGFNKIVAPEMAYDKLLEKRVQKLDRKLQQMIK